MKAELEKFVALNPYLETISAILQKPKFSYEVIEAYWLGNQLLSKANLGDYKILLDNFLKQGVPIWLVEELRRRQPKKFIPFHFFQILHVGVGRVSGSVPFNIETVNNCMVRWGKVLDIKKDEIIVDLLYLKASLKTNKDFVVKICNPKWNNLSTKVEYLPDLLPGVKEGDFVAVHWGHAVKVLSKNELNQLQFWTNEVLSLFI